MNREIRKCFLLALDTGISTAFFVHPNILVTTRHSVVGATKGRVIGRGMSLVANIAGIYTFDNLQEIDVAFIETKAAILNAQLKLSTKGLSKKDDVYVHGYPDAFGNTLTPMPAKVCKISSQQICYLFPTELVGTPTTLNGTSGGPVFKTKSLEVSALHSMSSFAPQTKEELPIRGYAIPSYIVHELLKSVVGNNLGKQ